MANINLEETLKRAQRKAADTDPEAYRDKVLSAARQAMKATKKSSIEIDHKKGKVRFSLDRGSDRIRMFVNGEEIPEGKIGETIADIDGIGAPKTAAEKVRDVIDASGVTKNIASRSFDATLRAAANQAKEASRSTGSLLRALLMMISRTVDAR